MVKVTKFSIETIANEKIRTKQQKTPNLRTGELDNSLSRGDQENPPCFMCLQQPECAS